MKTERRLPEWVNLLSKALLIMIFPLSFYGNNILQYLIFPPTGLLFTPQVNYLELNLSLHYVSTVIGTYLRNFGLGILVAFPGMFYNYKLAKVPVNQSYWKRGLGTAVAVYVLLLGIAALFNFSPFLTPGYYDYISWILYERLTSYGTLVIGVFIILPLVQRQAVIIGTPSAFHDYTLRQNETNPNLSITREKILGALLWFILCFGPLFVSIQFYGGYTNIGGILMSYSFDFYNSPYIDTYSLRFSSAVTPFSVLPMIALIGAFHFVFVRETYRYIRKEITRQRLISLALLSIIFPYIITMVFASPMFWFSSFLPIPLPLLQVAGFLVVRFHRPHVDQGERIWKEDRARMWWEKEEQAEVVVTTPERPIRNRDEKITVPISYLLISRIRHLTRRIRY